VQKNESSNNEMIQSEVLKNVLIKNPCADRAEPNE